MGLGARWLGGGDGGGRRGDRSAVGVTNRSSTVTSLGRLNVSPTIELTIQVDTLLNQLESRFDDMSEQVL